MRYAIVNKEKILAFKGGKGTCPLCDSIAIAHCGDIRSHHWKHQSKDDCDTWSEGMTQWHIDWQNCFPKEMQEVTIKKGEEKHRADVFIKHKELVIEFQNSPISQQDIIDRELFYGNIIWVLNCNSNSDKILIQDLSVGEWLKAIKIPSTYTKKFENYIYYQNMKTVDDYIKKVYSELIMPVSKKVNEFYQRQNNLIKNQLYCNTLQQLLQNYNEGFYKNIDDGVKQFITGIFNELEEINKEFYRVKEELEFSKLYKFEWPRIPKSWEISNKPIYFNIGDELYKLYSKEKYKNFFSVLKISKNKFIEDYLIIKDKPNNYKLDEILFHSNEFLIHETSQSKELNYSDGKLDFGFS